jgi:hypothetical protein
MPKLDFEKRCETRSKGGYIPYNFKNNIFDDSFPPHTVKMWNALPSSIQKNEDFKLCTKKKNKPPRYKHFAGGSKLGNTLLTRIRVGRSSLNQHKFTIGLANSPECICYFKTESPEHFFIDCFLYSPERQILFG